MRRARRFLEDAERAYRDGFYDLAMFYAEQAAQLALKALLVARLGFYPETHGIRELLGVYYRATGDEEAARISSRHRLMLAMLERAYTESECGADEYGEDEARAALEAARLIVGFVEERVGGV